MVLYVQYKKRIVTKPRAAGHCNAVITSETLMFTWTTSKHEMQYGIKYFDRRTGAG